MSVLLRSVAANWTVPFSAIPAPVAAVAQDVENLFHRGDPLADFPKAVVSDGNHAAGGSGFAEVADGRVGRDGVAHLVADDQ